MAEVEFEVMSVIAEHDRYRLRSHTAWLGDLVLSEDDFHRAGRPTVGDQLILKIYSYNEWINRHNEYFQSCKERTNNE